VTLEAEGTGRRLSVGDAIDVRVVGVEALRGRVELMPADGEPPQRRAPTRRRR